MKLEYSIKTLKKWFPLWNVENHCWIFYFLAAEIIFSLFPNFTLLNYFERTDLLDYSGEPYSKQKGPGTMYTHPGRDLAQDMHTPPWTEWQTPVKTLLSRNVAGGKNKAFTQLLNPLVSDWMPVNETCMKFYDMPARRLCAICNRLQGGHIPAKIKFPLFSLC